MSLKVSRLLLGYSEVQALLHGEVTLHDSLPRILFICDLLHSSDPRSQNRDVNFTDEKVKVQIGYDLPVGLAVSNILGSAGLIGPALSTCL